MAARLSTYYSIFHLDSHVTPVRLLLSFHFDLWEQKNETKARSGAATSRLFNEIDDERTTDEKSESLTWETFDYGGDPKWDPRSTIVDLWYKVK
jgi:hypothetical protein